MDINMTFYKTIQGNPFLENKILEILLECDDDFVPSLSSRRSVEEEHPELRKQKQLRMYLDEKVHHQFIIAMVDDHYIGFINFLHNYQLLEMPDFPHSNFIDTTCVLPEYRNLGIGQQMYAYLEKDIPSDIHLPYITRQTWSTNSVQNNMYKKFNYELLHCKKNDRGTGIDTVTYYKKL